VPDDCIFCRIAHREADASFVLEEEQVVAFMDVRAFHPGHTLVIPREHLVDIYALRDDTTALALMSAIARVARAVRTVFSPDGMNIWQSNGEAAGQEVAHVHFHAMPRYNHDGLLRVYPSSPQYPPRSELDTHARRIQDALSSSNG
jgi:histidine triad (HIT) family protein